jgi:hypothetical protein
MGHSTINRVKAFNDDTEYGFKAKIGDRFYAFILKNIACLLVSWILLIDCLIILYRRSRPNYEESHSAEPEQNTDGSSSQGNPEHWTHSALVKSENMSPGNAVHDIPPSYEESRTQYCMINTFFRLLFQYIKQ